MLWNVEQAEKNPKFKCLKIETFKQKQYNEIMLNLLKEYEKKEGKNAIIDQNTFDTIEN